jgi:hypothetical protein
MGTTPAVLKATFTKRVPSDIRLSLKADGACSMGTAVLAHMIACVPEARPEPGDVDCNWSVGPLEAGSAVVIQLTPRAGDAEARHIPLWVYTDGTDLTLRRGCAAEDEELYLMRPL